MPLPAPYAPPWKRLGEDGVALLAWLGLKGRELWRRNREGLLPVPAVWPRRRARLFWPLAVLAGLLLAGGVGWVWLSHAPKAPAETGVSVSAAVGAPGFQVSKDSEAAGASGTGDGSNPAGSTPPDAPEAVPSDDAERSRLAPRPVSGAEGDTSAIGTEGEPVVAPEAQDALEPQEALDPWQSLQPSEPLEPLEPLELPETPAEREARRLRAAWGTDADAALLREVSPDLARATLTLRFGEDLLALGVDQRQRLADRWRDRAADEGYSHLLLLDGRGRLWGRDALVGRGMILLDPPGRADAPP